MPMPVGVGVPFHKAHGAPAHCLNEVEHHLKGERGLGLRDGLPDDLHASHPPCASHGAFCQQLQDQQVNREGRVQHANSEAIPYVAACLKDLLDR